MIFFENDKLLPEGLEEELWTKLGEVEKLTGKKNLELLLTLYYYRFVPGGLQFPCLE